MFIKPYESPHRPEAAILLVNYNGIYVNMVF